MPSPIGTPYDVEPYDVEPSDVEPSDASVTSADSVIVDATAVNEVFAADVAAVVVTVAAGDGTAAVIGAPVVDEASTVVELSDVDVSDVDVSDAGTELAAPLVWSGAWTSLAHAAAISSSAMISAHLGDASPAVRQRTVVGVFCLTSCDRSPRASAMGERLRSVRQTIEMFEVPPQAEEFCALRVAAGLSPKDETAAAIALQRSLYAVCLRDEQRLVGMGRVVVTASMCRSPISPWTPTTRARDCRGRSWSRSWNTSQRCRPVPA